MNPESLSNALRLFLDLRSSPIGVGNIKFDKLKGLSDDSWVTWTTGGTKFEKKLLATDVFGFVAKNKRPIMKITKLKLPQSIVL